MEVVGVALGATADAAKYAAAYKKLMPVYSARFWNSTLNTWAADPMELQTLTSVSLGAGVGTAAQRKSAVEALDKVHKDPCSAVNSLANPCC